MNETKVPLRLWPAWAMIAVAAILVATTPFLVTRTMAHFIGLIGGPMLAALGICFVWWPFLSRVRGRDRWWPPALFVALWGAVIAILYLDVPLLPSLYFAPLVAMIWVIRQTIVRGRPWAAQRFGVLAVILGGWAATLLVRVDGADGEMVPDLRWAWKPSKEVLFERERAARQGQPKPEVKATIEVQPGDWPEFRGPNRDGISPSTIRTDWAANPPKELWRQRIGAGWGSFAVVGDRLFTQEQRGRDEAVVCYHTLTGTELWEARVPSYFKEDIAGEGPRATPTVHDGRVYAYSATGKLVALDALSGKQHWLREVTADYGAKIPQWAYSSSPLVIDGNVIVFTAVAGKAVAAYRAADGEPVWANGKGRHGYSSAQRFAFEGAEFVLMVSDYGIEAFDAKTGTARGEYAWVLPGQNRVSQPTVIGGKAILLGTSVGGDQGAKRLSVALKDGSLQFTEVWKSKSPKPYFNDGVVFENHYYGWDDRNFACVDLKNGKVKWDAGSVYGFGQVLLLPAQKLLLVLTVTGDVVLLNASPEEHFEVAKFAAIEGKTWNHPVVSAGKLYVRNGTEAACYDLTPAAK